jgi:hypothetical protein
MFGDAVYVQLEDTATAAGNQYVIDVADALSTSQALAACKRGQTVAGTVIVTLQLAGRHVGVTVGGPIADAPVGACIRDAAEEVVRATPLPEGVTNLPINNLPVHVP